MADSSVNTGVAGVPLRLLTLLGLASAGQQVVTIADSTGALLGTTGAPLPVVPATITKGTQGSNGVTTQDLKDAGRTPVVLSAAGIATVTAEALLSFGQWKAGTATTGATSYTVTTGKTFRLQAVRVGVRFATPSTTVTFANAKVNLRAITTGTLSTTSALVMSETVAAASNLPTADIEFTIPDGLEFGSGYVFGVSHIDSATTLLIDVTLVGYEY